MSLSVRGQAQGLEQLNRSFAVGYRSSLLCVYHSSAGLQTCCVKGSFLSFGGLRIPGVLWQLRLPRYSLQAKLKLTQVRIPI
mmetsp:Transcript_6615/g.12424  ORF Transcript_6615/g.12424 Transcript_6615/m.12424 type:complete len:82 (-) Transcript_6615:340-585(-)